MARDKRQARRGLKSSRIANAVNERDSKGFSGAFQDVIDWSKMGSIEFLKLEADKSYKMNIIPWEIRSKYNPTVAKGELEVGDLDMMLDVWVHRFFGPSRASILCPKKSYGKRCPICEEAGRHFDAKDTEAGRNLSPTRRCYAVVQLIEKGKPGPLQVLHHSYSYFMKEILEEANACDHGKGPVNFADHEHGKVVSFRTVEGNFKKSVMLKKVDFLDREEEIGDAVLDEAPSLDEHLIVLNYEEIGRLMSDEPEEEDNPFDREDESEDRERDYREDPRDQREEDDRPARGRERALRDELEEDEEVERRETRRVNREIEEEEREEPRSRRYREDEPEEDDRVGKPEGQADADKCPSGHKFGEDYEATRACRNCPTATWKACGAARKASR